MIGLENLKVGDIIFYSPANNDMLSDHVAIITKIIYDHFCPENSEIFITHAVTGTHNTVTETLLRPIETTTFYAFRFKSPELAKLAAILAKNFISRGIPFSSQRSSTIMSNTDDKLYGLPKERIAELIAKMVKDNIALYQDFEYLNTLKYAARRGAISTDASVSDEFKRSSLTHKKGFNCSGFITIIIQLAELLSRIPNFPRTEQLAGLIPWISDKYCDLSQYDSEVYIRIMSQLNPELNISNLQSLVLLYQEHHLKKFKTDKYIKPQGGSAHYFNSVLDLISLSRDFNIAQLLSHLQRIQINGVLMLCPHKTSPSILKYYISHVGLDHYQFIGEFNTAEKVFTEDQRTINRSLVGLRFLSASFCRAQVSESVRLSSTGRGSPEHLAAKAAISSSGTDSPFEHLVALTDSPVCRLRDQ